jgi:hypothetical protein
MKKIAGMVIGASLAVAAAYSLADGKYYATESGYITDDDGRVYSYVIYGINEATTPVFTNASDVNTDSRGAPPIAEPSAQSVDTPTYSVSASAESTVFVKAPDVNEVFGRA